MVSSLMASLWADVFVGFGRSLLRSPGTVASGFMERLGEAGGATVPAPRCHVMSWDEKKTAPCPTVFFGYAKFFFKTRIVFGMNFYTWEVETRQTLRSWVIGISGTRRWFLVWSAVSWLILQLLWACPHLRCKIRALSKDCLKTRDQDLPRSSSKPRQGQE